VSSPFAHADPPPFEERLLACQSPPLITRSGERPLRGKTVSVGKKRREGRSRRVDRAMMAAPDPLAYVISRKVERRSGGAKSGDCWIRTFCRGVDMPKLGRHENDPHRNFRRGLRGAHRRRARA
jgi:hypothetical protein